ncbi:hypothetical protein DW322_01025 [Rhodococcus rhodnii]|uniref:Uncharacterized protein n=2 Tax=Rhodococcus rhodnii TaxID=38312 RepID=R7WH22_9NOCA|nr:hypothetical protein [Rhodococcus rhodnii]EOM74361.1 hypothetical protein Rrhod_4162 [Rhodococcus rhodnii LMG 5362]TXG88276.1 hypothetical protein DW322_21580 [Rhodococcus rhodnii]TXG89086.1 hypothetical protein DW322_01025 [Rhodococcus rhodnii]
MTTRHTSHRRVDAANLIVLVVAVASGIFAYTLVTYASMNALVIVPAVVVATLSVPNLIKREAPRE